MTSPPTWLRCVIGVSWLVLALRRPSCCCAPARPSSAPAPAVEEPAPLPDLVASVPEQVPCWACDRGVPHVHRGGTDCPHEFADGEVPRCCSDYAAERVALLQLGRAIRLGRQAVPDSPAGLVAVDDERN